MKCRKCGTEIAANALICYRCGTAVEDLPSVGSSRVKKERPGWIPLALSWVLLLLAGLAATLTLPPDIPPLVIWSVVVVLAVLLTGWRMIRRRR